MKLERIVVASGNKNKLAELSTVARRFNIPLVTPKEIQQELALGEPPDVTETGSTFRENAILKAEAFAEWSGLPALGDDSGIEVYALGNAPGIYSARYAGEGKTDMDRITKLLTELDRAILANPTLDRRGQFRCVLTLVSAGSVIAESEGILTGTILHEPRGALGFGYDPIIELDSLGKTLAEMDFEVTCEKGFRAIAAEELFRKLAN